MIKKLISAIIILGIFALVSCSGSSGSTELSSKSKIEGEKHTQDFSYIDEKLNDIILSSSYKNGNLDNRVQLLKPVLEQLIKEECIVEYKFDLEADIPSAYFEYSGGGSVLLKEFSKNQN